MTKRQRKKRERERDIDTTKIMLQLLLSSYNNPTVMLSMIKYIVSTSRERERAKRKIQKRDIREIDTSYGYVAVITELLQQPYCYAFNDKVDS